MSNIRKLEPKDHYDQMPEMHERPKRFRKHDHDESNWLISYADMMTLLCMFYVMMFSMSKINSAEFEKVKQTVAEHFGTKYQSPTEDLGKFINNVLTETGVVKEATMSTDGISVTIAFHSTLFFETGSADISTNGKAILAKLMSGLSDQQKKIGKNYKIVVEGHTDSQPILSTQFPSNWELSSGRATRVVRLFLDQGYLPQNLLAIGYADTQPLAESKNADGNWNEENLAKNRRVVLRVLLPEVDSIPWKTDSKTTEFVAPKATAAAAPSTSEMLKRTVQAAFKSTSVPTSSKVIDSVVAIEGKKLEAAKIEVPVNMAGAIPPTAAVIVNDAFKPAPIAIAPASVKAGNDAFKSLVPTAAALHATMPTAPLTVAPTEAARAPASTSALDAPTNH
jgi:chemotaxis protein MotB